MGDWQALAAAHRAKQNESIPAEWRLDKNLLAEISGEGTDDAGRLVRSQAVKKSRLLTEKELEITDNFTATQLLDKIARRELTSLEVATAFCKRAALAQQLTSCLTEIFFDEGIERAKWLDKYLQEEGHVVGPLHGLPISLKDSFIVKGQHATVGYVEALRRPLLDDTSTLVDMLLDAGAIIYCKTNVPQTMMTADSENNLFGRTLNPHNTKLTAGGSTGGEGALLAFKGSPLGVGTDIAGSIRIPSLCCGIYGFKPTAERVPFSGNTRGPFPRLRIPGGVIPAAGPMGNSVEDLELFMRVITDMRPWKYDATVHDVPWRRQETTGQKVLTIGVLPEDETYRLQPPVRRALDSAVEALARAGHKIVHLPRDDSRSVALGAVLGFYCFGLGGPPLDNLEEEFKEPLIPSVKRGVHPFGSASFSIPQDLDFPQLLDRITGARSEYSDSWKRTWITHDLDVIIGPGAQHTAVPHDTYGNPVYTLVWNVLDYPAGIIPYEEVRKEHDPHHVKATAPFDPHYDPEELHGAPCALQIVTPRFRDEECLSAMRIIDEVLHRKQ